MLLQPELGRRDQTLGDGKQPGFAGAMSAPIDGHGFQAEIALRSMGHPLGMDQRPLSRDVTTSISIEVPLSLWRKHKAAYTLTQISAPAERRDCNSCGDAALSSIIVPAVGEQLRRVS